MTHSLIKQVSHVLVCSLIACGSQALSAPPDSSKENSQATNYADEPARNGDSIPARLQILFKRLDAFNRDKIKDARFVELELTEAWYFGGQVGNNSRTESAWLINQDDDSIVVLQEDLIPSTFNKKGTTTIPSNWSPTPVRLKAVKDADFEKMCQELIKPRQQEDEFQRMRREIRGAGPSRRLLIAHAAWKKGLSKYCEPILSDNPKFKNNFPEYQAEVLDDLAWLHLLRAVNLLMFADREEVLPHLRFVIELAPKSKYAVQAKDLLGHLEKMIADKKKDDQKTNETELTTAELYVSQLKDLRCSQTGQPGFIDPTEGTVDGKLTPNPPTSKLKAMGMEAVPALIAALEDDTPTRTVYHWRDFARSRMVWRVSDFAWNILRDITHKEFGYRRIVGFTLSSMTPEQKQQTIKDIKAWYAANKDLSPDDRMFGFFSSRDSEDWITAAAYFLKKKDKRAVKPLLEKILQARSFTKGDLCELVAQFGDPTAKEVIRQVLQTADEDSDRISAAIALWKLGDDAGIPLAIKYLKQKDQPYGGWSEPTWFLVQTRSKEAMAALKSVVTGAPPERAGEVLDFIEGSITGEFFGEDREPVGGVELCPVLIAAMERSDKTGATINDIEIRIKDAAASAFVLLRQGTDKGGGGLFSLFTPKQPELFNQLEPDASKRDAQIESLQTWYKSNKDKLAWDSKRGRLVVKDR